MQKPQPGITQRSSPLSSRNPVEVEVENFSEAVEIEDNRRRGSESLRRAHKSSQGLKQETQGLPGSLTGPLHIHQNIMLELL